MSKSLFAEKLRAARKMSGVSMEDLANKLDHPVSKQSISKYERGLSMPSGAILSDISRALDLPLDYFFRDSSLQLKKVEFRKKSSLRVKEKDQILAQSLDFAERYIELESLVSPFRHFQNPFGCKIKVNDESEAERAAYKLRKVWDLGYEPLLSITSVLEDRGIIVYELDAGDSFSGLSAEVDGRFIIVLNKSSEVCRKRFSLMHELAHLLLDFDSETESLCHYFAGSFLMPRKVFIREFSPSSSKRTKITWEELWRLKSFFGASLGSIIVRARQVDLIGENFYTQIFKTFSSLGYRKEEPNDCQNDEVPNRFNQLLHIAISEGLVTMSKASQLARVSIEKLRKEYSLLK